MEHFHITSWNVTGRPQIPQPKKINKYRFLPLCGPANPTLWIQESSSCLLLDAGCFHCSSVDIGISNKFALSLVKKRIYKQRKGKQERERVSFFPVIYGLSAKDIAQIISELKIWMFSYLKGPDYKWMCLLQNF